MARKPGFLARLRGAGQAGAPLVAPRQHHALSLNAAPVATYAVGDVHGCADAYKALEAQILADIATQGGPCLIVLLGDIVDRGAKSAAMIDHLLAPTPAGVQRLVLLGNHEDMFLDFIDAPDGKAAWLGHGGRETLLSYGMSPDRVGNFDMPTERLAMIIGAHVPDHHLAFLRQLPLCLRIGGWFLSHAGFDPDLPLEAQPSEALIWGRPDRIDAAPAGQLPDGLRAIHGHVPGETPVVTARRIGIDTGACFGGTLTAVRLIEGQEPAFFTERA